MKNKHLQYLIIGLTKASNKKYFVKFSDISIYVKHTWSRIKYAALIAH